MKKWVTIGVLFLCLVLAGATACDLLGDGDKGETSQQLVTVVKGDLTVSVSGSGNIEVANEATLTFGSGGRVDKLNVEEGDVVSKGDVLARLDTSTLELAHTQATVALTQAQLAVTQAQLAEQTAEYNLKKTKDTKDALELALFNAQINTQTAKYNLEKTRDLYTWTDIKVAQADVDESEEYLEYCIKKLYEYLPIILDEEGREVYPKIEDDFTEPPGYKVWQDRIIHAQSRLNSAKDRLEAMQSGRDTEETAIKRKQLEAAEMAEAQAEKNLNDLREDIAIQKLQLEAAKQATEQTRQSVELAQQSLAEAQKQLDEATITAPFGGVVASVSVKEGNIIPSPTVSPKAIVYLVDLSSMKLIAELDEIDLPDIELNQEAIITIDALPDATFKGKVASINPVPTQAGGIVLYKVKIGFDVPDGSRLRVGMSASVDIITAKRSDVLLVPSRAIGKNSQGEPIAKVMINEQIQERPVTIGISDGLDTEIIDGLDEGELVMRKAS